MVAKKMLKVSRIGGFHACTDSQRDTLLGLGLRRQHKVRELEDTPSVRGMIRTVQHLVAVHDEAVQKKD